MSFRAKLRVQTVTRSENEGVGVKMTAQYSDNKEDNSYSKWTPSATFEMFVTNPDVIAQIEPGKQFYVDFTEITK